jgi:hypothetical protein
MKPAGYLLFFSVGTSCWGQAAEPPPGLVSKQTKAHIREGLPKFQAKAPEGTEDSSNEEATPADDPDLLVLPTMTVKEKRLPSDAADHLANRDDVKRKMENIYLDEVAAVGRLNYFLNSFTIPILSPSKEERGRAIYIQRELDRLNRVTLLPETAPAEAAPVKK